MYQIEVKKYIINHKFPPKDGWEVFADLDSMEMAKGGVHPPGKKEKAATCKKDLEQLGVNIGAHPIYGRVDIVAKKPNGTEYLIEVEGDTSRQPEQAMYSALGQIILQIKQKNKFITYGFAVPDDPKWENQIKKIPPYVLNTLNVKIYLVSSDNVREY